MERYIYRWLNANGDVQERLLNEKQWASFQKCQGIIDLINRRQAEVIRVQFGTIFNE